MHILSSLLFEIVFSVAISWSSDKGFYPIAGGYEFESYKVWNLWDGRALPIFIYTRIKMTEFSLVLGTYMQ